MTAAMPHDDGLPVLALNGPNLHPLGPHGHALALTHPARLVKEER